MRHCDIRRTFSTFPCEIKDTAGGIEKIQVAKVLSLDTSTPPGRVDTLSGK
jgi:hypothetical protein